MTSNASTDDPATREAASDDDAVANPTEDPPALSAMTYNVRYSGLDAGDLDWAARRPAVVAAIRTVTPHVLALQECWLGQADDLAADLADYEWLGEADSSGKHTPIGYRPDRLVLQESTVEGIAPGGERGVPAWDADLPRTLTVGAFRDRRTGATFSVASVHLDHRGERARLEGARFVRNRVETDHAVVAGDLNCAPGSEPYRVLAGAFDDACEVAHRRRGPRETYVGFPDDPLGGDEPATPRRIDYAFVRGFDVTAYETVDAANATGGTARSLAASDHRPVVVELARTDG